MTEQLDQKTSQLKMIMSQSRNDKLLKAILELAENQEVDEIADVISSLLESLPITKQKSILNIISRWWFYFSSFSIFKVRKFLKVLTPFLPLNHFFFNWFTYSSLLNICILHKIFNTNFVPFCFSTEWAEQRFKVFYFNKTE